MIEILKHGIYTKKYVHTCSKCGAVVTFQQEDIDKNSAVLKETQYETVTEGKATFRRAREVKTPIFRYLCPEAGCGQVDKIPLAELEEYTDTKEKTL